MEKEELEEEKTVEIPKSTSVSAKKAKETLNLHKIATEVHNDGHGFYDNEKRLSLLNEGYTAEQVHDIMTIANENVSGQHNDIRPDSGVKAKVSETATENKDLVGKAFLLIAGKLDEKNESEGDMEEIRKIRMAILTGKKY